MKYGRRRMVLFKVQLPKVIVKTRIPSEWYFARIGFGLAVKEH